MVLYLSTTGLAHTQIIIIIILIIIILIIGNIQNVFGDSKRFTT